MFGEAWSPMSVPDLAPDDDNYQGPHVIVAVTLKSLQVLVFVLTEVN